MAQALTQIPADQPGLTYRGLNNDANEAIATFQKGSSAPAAAASESLSGMIWCDDASDPTWIYKQYDGTDWNEIFRINITTGAVTFPSVTKQDYSTNYCVTTGTGDTYVGTISGIASLTDGLEVTIETHNPNVGAATFNLNGTGAKTIKKKYNQDLADNDFLAGMHNKLSYDQTNDWWQLISPVAN